MKYCVSIQYEKILKVALSWSFVGWAESMYPWKIYFISCNSGGIRLQGKLTFQTGLLSEEKVPPRDISQYGWTGFLKAVGKDQQRTGSNEI